MQCPLPNQACSQEIPSNLWSGQLIVLDLWWRIAQQPQLGANSACQWWVGAGEHAVALWSGDCLAIAHTLVIF